jgi:hypothetical protein
MFFDLRIIGKSHTTSQVFTTQEFYVFFDGRSNIFDFTNNKNITIYIDRVINLLSLFL